MHTNQSWGLSAKGLLPVNAPMPNRLARETSPYLQQHAHNPVDWYPWGEEALAEARRANKPILLSVGYSACHWCHVMAHESFEDQATAKVMNELFVNIKVDREERPDIDQIYQLAQALLTQRNGGWPLTMFLTPDQLPFFGGTYFPPTQRYGMPAFTDVLRRVRDFYDRHPDEIRAQGTQVAQALARTGPRGRPQQAADFSREPLEDAVEHLAANFDSTHGGFGSAPKFPHPDSIEVLLRHHARTGDPRALEMATFTLRSMARGGIYDQVGGGFARYSVDARWAIPHFEKMLYDNGWLLRVYADAWAATRDPLFEKVCAETAGWLVREMQAADGGYYSSIDADSEGEEGKFYVWTPGEVQALLSPEEFQVASLVFGLDREPNFEGHAWHLVMARSIEEAARALEIREGAVELHLDAARRKLREARERRVRPGLDDKVLTSWNALAIAGMARAGRALRRPEWIASARRALAFIRSTLWHDGKLLATAKDGRAHLDAYLDDYAYLLNALLEMLQADFDVADLDWAQELADALMERFHDAQAGGFFFTAHDHETLIHRPKPGPDNATPSGNAMAALGLNRLSFLTGDMRYSQAARGTLALFQQPLEAQPTAFGTMLAALEEQLEPPRTIIVSGARDALDPWREMLDPQLLPSTMVACIPAGTPGLPPVLAKGASDAVNAWVCEGVTCLSPLDTPEKLRETLKLPRIAPFAERQDTGAPR